MRVAVTGATGVLGSAAVASLLAADHTVVGLARSRDAARRLRQRGAEVVMAGPDDPPGLVGLLEGADAVCNLATHLPVGLPGTRRRAWRRADRLRVEGAMRLVEAARDADVRHVVQESASFLYADHGSDWVDEGSSLDITRYTEPVCVAESAVEGFRCGSRTGVVLRFGLVVGEDPMTRWQLRAARAGRPFGVGDPRGFLHPLHTEDVGPAVVAALHAPSGVYNVGAQPVRRGEYVEQVAAAAGRPDGSFLGPAQRRLAGGRVEPWGRSLRVSSDRFTSVTGWSPRHPQLDRGWFTPLSPALG